MILPKNEIFDKTVIAVKLSNTTLYLCFDNVSKMQFTTALINFVKIYLQDIRLLA